MLMTSINNTHGIEKESIFTRIQKPETAVSAELLKLVLGETVLIDSVQ